MRVVCSVTVYRRVLDTYIYNQMKIGGISCFEDVFGKQGRVDTIVQKSEGCETFCAGFSVFWFDSEGLKVGGTWLGKYEELISRRGFGCAFRT